MMPLRPQQTGEELGVGDVFLLGGAQLFVVNLQDALQVEVLQQLFQFFTRASLLMVLRIVVQQEVVARHLAQDHAFDPVQVVETIAGGFAHGGQQRFPGILAHQAQQLAQGKHDQLAAVFLQSRDIVGDLGRGLENELFFGMGIGALDALAPRRAVLRPAARAGARPRRCAGG